VARCTAGPVSAGKVWPTWSRTFSPLPGLRRLGDHHDAHVSGHFSGDQHVLAPHFAPSKNTALVDFVNVDVDFDDQQKELESRSFYGLASTTCPPWSS
jgi:hypothetical protein